MKTMIMLVTIIIAWTFLPILEAQLNLGSLNLFKNAYGDLELGLGQGGNLFGYGADRSLQLTMGPGRFGTRTDGGVMLGGERVGVDSRIGINEAQGLNLGSLLQLGNNRAASDPLGAMLRNIGSFLRLPEPSATLGLASKRSRPATFLPSPNGGDGVEESGELPLSVGKGWDGDGNDGDESKEVQQRPQPPSEKSEELPEVSGPLTSRRIIQPPTRGFVNPSPNPNPRLGTLVSNRVTTEGRRGGTDTSSGQKRNGGDRHDGGTGEFNHKGKLPIPDGLEMISSSSSETRRRRFLRAIKFSHLFKHL